MPVFRETERLLAEVQAGRRTQVYLIVGDPILTQPLHQALVQVLLPEESRSFNWEQVDGEHEPLADILERVQTFPLFPGPKVVSVKNLPFLSPVDKKDLIEKAHASWKNGEPLPALQYLSRLCLELGLPRPGTGPSRSGDPREPVIAALGKIKADIPPEWIPQVLDYWERSEIPWPAEPVEDLERAMRDGFPKEHFLILINERAGRQKKIVAWIEKTGSFIDLTPEAVPGKGAANAMRRYLKKRLAEEGKRIDPQAETLLLNRAGAELALLEMEIQKLAAYADRRAVLTKDDVDQLVGLNREEPLYELTAFLGEKRPLQALRVLQRLWEQGLYPLAVLRGMVNAYRRFLLAREWLEALPPGWVQTLDNFQQFGKKIGAWVESRPLPGPLSKLKPYGLFSQFRTARHFDRLELIQALESLYRLERRMKTTGGDERWLLEDFIRSRCRSRPASSEPTQRA